MKKIKLLTPIMGIATLGSVVMPLAGCSCTSSTSTNEVKVINNVGYIFGADRETELLYCLTNPLQSGQRLAIEHEETTEFTFDQPEVRYNHISVTVKVASGYKDGSFYNKGLKFICYDENSKEVWSQNVECFAYYDEIAALQGAKEVYTETGEKTYTFKYVLPYNPEKYGRYVKPFLLTNRTSEDGLSIYIKSYDLSTEAGKTTFTVTVEMSKDSSTALWNGAEWANFDIELYGLDSNNSQVWHTSTKGAKLTYTSPMVAIPSSACTISADGELQKITLSANANENTLDLNQSGFENVTSIAKDLWTNSTGLDNIIGLRLNSKCSYFGESCFKNSKIIYIDMTQMPDDAEWFKGGEFADYSFQGLPSNGTIKYNSNWKSVMKHRINTALYRAGLTDSSWYDFTTVYNYAELINAFQTGGFIKLGQNITIPATVLQKEGIQTHIVKDWTEEIVVEQSSCLDLNGFTLKSAAPIYYTNETEERVAMIAIWNGAELVVEDTSANQTGKMIAYDEVPESEVKSYEGNTYCFNVHADNTSRYAPSLLINSGKFYGTRTCIHNNGAQVQIDGGEFHLNRCAFSYWYNEYLNAERFMLNCKGDAYEAGTSDFWITGGKFFGWKYTGKYADKNVYNPAKDEAETKINSKGVEICACYLYDHDPDVDADTNIANSAWYLDDTNFKETQATEAGAEGYYEIKLKPSKN